MPIPDNLLNQYWKRLLANTNPQPPIANEASWGQSKQLGPPWVENEPQVVTMFSGRRTLGFPEVMTVNLGVDYLTRINTDTIFRWRLRAGVGGAQRFWLVDALPMQQVSLPAQDLEVSIVCTEFTTQFPSQYTAPENSLRATAFIARGQTSTSQAQYTEGFAVTAGTPQNFLFPPGAVGYRIGGDPLNGPFAATSLYETHAGSGGAFVRTQLNGAELLTLARSDGYVPIPGGTDSLEIRNEGAGTILGIIQWELDL